MRSFTAEASAGRTHAVRQLSALDCSCPQQAPSRTSATLHPAVAALQAGTSQRLGVAFSGAGFGAAYQLGAAEMLRSLQVLQADTPVSGASAGAFVAAACRCSIPFVDVLSALKEASSSLLQHGQLTRLTKTLKPIMQQLLPDNAHQLCSPTPPGVDAPAFVIAATRVKGICPMCWHGEEMLTGFSSKEDLVDMLLVGAHQPVVSDGKCCVRYRRQYWMDAGLQLPVAPIPGVSYTLIIYPICNALLTRRWPYKLLMHPPPPEAIAISPGQYRPWPYSRDYKKAQHLVMQPQPPEVLDMLFERGRREALSWAQHVGLPAHLASNSAAPAAAAGAGVSQVDEATKQRQLLLTLRVSELPTMVPVPQDLMHML